MSEDSAIEEGTWLSHIRGLPKTPTNLRKMFLLLTRVHYSNPDHFGDYRDEMKRFVWTEGEDPTLRIDPEGDFQNEDQAQLPRIFVGLDHMRFNTPVVDARGYPTEDRGSNEYVERGQTAIRVRHVGSTVDESQTLAEMTSSFFRGIRPMMMEDVGFHRYTISAITNPDPFQKTSTEAFQSLRSDVIIELHYSEDWLVMFDSHRVKAILPASEFILEAGNILK